MAKNPGKVTPEAAVSMAEDINEEKVIFEWLAPERGYKPRNKDYWVTAIAILVLLSVILFFIKEIFLIIALFSVLFLYYVLSTVPPENIKHTITNRGVYFGESKYGWDWMRRFWINSAEKYDIIMFETWLKFPRQVAMMVNTADTQKVAAYLLGKMPKLESSPTTVDKLTKWVGERLPLEDKPKSV